MVKNAHITQKILYFSLKKPGVNVGRWQLVSDGEVAGALKLDKKF